MTLTLRPVLALALGAAVLTSAPAWAAESPPTPMAHTASCGSIRLGHRTYVFFRSGLTCTRAKRHARFVYRTHRAPRYYACESGSGYRSGGGCHSRSGDRFFGWHPFD